MITLQAPDVIPTKDGSEAPQQDTPNSKVANSKGLGVESAHKASILKNSQVSSDLKEESLKHQDKDQQVKLESNSLSSAFLTGSLTISEQQRSANVGIPTAAKVVKSFSFLYYSS